MRVVDSAGAQEVGATHRRARVLPGSAVASQAVRLKALLAVEPAAVNPGALAAPQEERRELAARKARSQRRTAGSRAEAAGDSTAAEAATVSSVRQNSLA